MTTASADGRPVQCDGDIQIRPNVALKDVGKTDLIFVPTTGLSVDDVVERNAAIVPWLKRRSTRGVAIASVCSGVGLVAAAGLLDGKRATTHWGLAERFREKYPRVKWMPELMVTEDHGFYCGGGVNASLDLSIYLVERFCGHEIAMQTSKALLIETPRAWQSGFAIVPLKTDHTDDNISSAQEWMHKNFAKTFSLEEPAHRVGMSVEKFRAPLQGGDWGQPVDLSAEIADRCGEENAGEQPSLDAGDQRGGGLPGPRVFSHPLSASHRRIAKRLSGEIRSVRITSVRASSFEIRTFFGETSWTSDRFRSH